MKNLKTGLVLGKFMPFHKGHEALITFAKEHVQRLFIVVDNVPSFKGDLVISGKTRVEWIQKYIPEAEVFFLPIPMPQQPLDCDDFWGIWKDALIHILPKNPDFIFGSENYGYELSQNLECEFIPFDIDRKKHPISATKIREDLWENWNFLSESAKPSFMFKICIFGPESTGKTTLCKELSNYFQTVFIPEFARTFLEDNLKKDKNFHLQPTDMIHIAHKQLEKEEQVSQEASRLYFSDTDVLTTAIWDQWLFEGINEADILSIAQKQAYDFYLVLPPTTKWEKDSVRFFEKQEDRDRFLKDCIKTLEREEKTYHILDSSETERYADAILIIERLLKDQMHYSYFAQKII